MITNEQIKQMLKDSLPVKKKKVKESPQVKVSE